MKFLSWLFIFPAILGTAVTTSFGYSPFSSLVPPQTAERPSSVIEGIQPFGKSSGIVITSGEIYRTDDNGETWSRLPVSVPFGAKLVSAWFVDETAGVTAAADPANAVIWILRTRDGGDTWRQDPVELIRNGAAEDLSLLNLSSARVRVNEKGELSLKVDLVTSSNFRTTMAYHQPLGQRSFSYTDSVDEPSVIKQKQFYSLKDEWESVVKSSGGRMVGDLPADPVIERHQTDSHSGYKVHSDWFLTQSGSCAGFKTGCVQTTRLYKNASFTDSAGKFVV